MHAQLIRSWRKPATHRPHPHPPQPPPLTQVGGRAPCDSHGLDRCADGHVRSLWAAAPAESHGRKFLHRHQLCQQVLTLALTLTQVERLHEGAAPLSASAPLSSAQRSQLRTLAEAANQSFESKVTLTRPPYPSHPHPRTHLYPRPHIYVYPRPRIYPHLTPT